MEEHLGTNTACQYSIIEELHNVYIAHVNFFAICFDFMPDSVKYSTARAAKLVRTRCYLSFCICTSVTIQVRSVALRLRK